MEPRLNRARTPILIAAVTALLYLPRLGSAPIYVSPDEVFISLHAESIARTGRDYGGRLLPLYVQYNYIVYDRVGNRIVRNGWLPPIIYYATALVLKVLPFSEATVRLPTAIVGIVDVLLMYFIGRRLFKNEPLAVLWQAATVLRELRGDGHVLAQLAVGLDGLATMVLRSGHDLDRDALQPNRGWTDDEWAASAEALTGRGLLGPEGRITPAGADLLDRAEALTDELAQEPWTLAGAEVAERFFEVAAPLAAAARTALPAVNPIGLPGAIGKSGSARPARG